VKRHRYALNTRSTVSGVVSDGVGAFARHGSGITRPRCRHSNQVTIRRLTVAEPDERIRPTKSVGEWRLSFVVVDQASCSLYIAIKRPVRIDRR